VEQVRLSTQDGYELGALFHPAQRPRPPQRAAVLHGGVGIPAARYRHFARFLSEWGISVLAYDYRGIGMSRPRSLRGFRATTADLVQYDGAAAIAWLRERFPHHEMIGISHSIGALPACAAPNAGSQDRLILICAHTGYYGDYRSVYRLPMALLWHAFMPLVTGTLGYFPARSLGLGEDIPAGIALEWARRRSPDLRGAGLPGEHQRICSLLDGAATLQRSTLALTISDDAFASVAGLSRLLSYFPRLDVRKIVVKPAETGMSRLGHLGFFRREAAGVLWPRLLALLEEKQH
jgi:predicted alpha/beta hydrolase